MITKNKSSKSTKARWITGFAVAVVVGLSAGASVSASATTVTLTGSQDQGTLIQYSTARTNTFAQNAVSFKLASVGGGASVTLGLRNSSATQFSNSLVVSTAYKSFTMASTGSAGIQPGTFYMNARLSAACGAGGCGQIAWSGSLIYNIKYS